MSTVRNHHSMKAKLVPTSFLSQDQVVASLSQSPSAHRLRALRRGLMALNVLPCKHRKSHAEQNQCGFRGRHNIFLLYVDCFPWDPCVFLNLMLNPVVMCDAFSNDTANLARCPEEFFFRTLARELFAFSWTQNNKCGSACSSLKIEIVASMLWCSCVQDRNSCVFPGTLSTWIGGSAFFRITSQNNFVRHTTVHSTFVSCAPA